MENGKLPINPIAGIGAGLTKREYFAAMAMQGIMAYNPKLTHDAIAKFSVQQADKLLEELNK